MRPHLLLLALCVLCLATPAPATPLEGAWGVGVRLFDYGGEVSLLRGVTDRTALLFDVSADQHEYDVSADDPADSPYGHLSTTIDLNAGPRLRRFTRPEEDFTPYWDVFAHGTWARARSRYPGSGLDTEDSWGVEGGFAFGLEYFTRWHCSLAAHSELLTVSWRHLRSTVDRSSTSIVTTGHDQSASLGLNPSLVLRVYF